MTSLNKAPSVGEEANAVMKNHVNSPINGMTPRGYEGKGYKDGKKLFEMVYTYFQFFIFFLVPFPSSFPIYFFHYFGQHAMVQDN